MHTDNGCLQLRANIWLFTYCSQQGSSSSLYFHEAGAQGSSDLRWKEAQLGLRGSAAPPSQMRRSEVEASSPSFLSLMVSRKMPNSLKKSYTSKTVVLSTLIFQQCWSDHQDKSSPQCRGQVEVRKLLLMKDTSAKDRQAADGGSASVNNYIL